MRLTLNLAFLLLTRQLLAQGVPRRTECNFATASDAKLHVKANEMPLPPHDSWLKRLENSVGANGGTLPYPTQPELLRELRDGLVGSPPRLRRGPLQLILELEWSQALSRKRGSVR